MKLILQRAHETAKAILEQKRAKVEELAALLLEKEVVDREDFLKLIDGDGAAMRQRAGGAA